MLPMLRFNVFNALGVWIKSYRVQAQSKYQCHILVSLILRAENIDPTHCVIVLDNRKQIRGISS